MAYQMRGGTFMIPKSISKTVKLKGKDKIFVSQLPNWCQKALLSSQ